jgi:hypothetical protein
MFLLLHFLLHQKLLEGICQDSSDCSIRALLISWPMLISMTLVHIHTLTFLLLKNYS